MKLINNKYFLTLSFLIMSHSAQASIESLTQECIAKSTSISIAVRDGHKNTERVLEIWCSKYGRESIIDSRMGPELEKHPDTKRVNDYDGEYRLILISGAYRYYCEFNTDGIDRYYGCMIEVGMNHVKSVLSQSLNTK